MNSKRIPVLLTALALILSLAACGGKSSDGKPNNSAPGNSSSVADRFDELTGGDKESGAPEASEALAEPTAEPTPEPTPVPDGIHIREEGDTLYFSGTGTIQRGDYDGYTPVNVVVEKGITGIGTYAFESCYTLASVTLPDSLETIGESAFAGSGLTSVILPDGLTDIEGAAFKNCPNLTSVTIPGSVKIIWPSAFASCPMTSITLPDGLEIIGDEAFYKSGLTSIVIPDSVNVIWPKAFYNCTSLTEVTLGAGLTELSERAFLYCPMLTKIKAPNSIQEVVIKSGIDLALVEWY